MDFLNSKMSRELLAMLLILLSTEGARGAQRITQGPGEVTTFVGGTFKVACVTENMAADEGIRIKLQRGEKLDKFDVIYQSLPANWIDTDWDPTKYKLTKPTDNHFEITVKDVSFSDGGIYLCEFIMSQTGGASSGTTIVLGTPQITVGENLQAEKMGRVSCTAEYTGPFMETDPERIPGITGMIQDETKTGDVTHRPGDAQVNPIVEYVLNTTLYKRNNGQNFTCILSTARPEVQTTSAVILDIKYEVVNLAIAPKNEAFYPGEFINCTAEGNPSPDIIWSPIKSSTPHQSKERLEIVEGMGADGDETWECAATNTAADLPFTIKDQFSFKVLEATAPPDPGENKDNASVNSLAIGLGVAIPLILIIIIAIIAIVLFTRGYLPVGKKSSTKSVEGGETGPYEGSGRQTPVEPDDLLTWGPMAPKQKVVRIEENNINDDYDTILAPDTIPRIRPARPKTAQSHPGMQGPGPDMTPSHPGMQGPRPDMTPSHPGMQGPGPDMTPSHPGMQGPRPDMTPSHPGMQGPGPDMTPSHPGMQGPPPDMTPSHPGMQGPPPDMTPSHPGMQGTPPDMTPSHPGMQGPPPDMTPSHPGMQGTPPDMTPSHPGMQGPPPDMTPSHPGMQIPPPDKDPGETSV